MLPLPHKTPMDPTLSKLERPCVPLSLCFSFSLSLNFSLSLSLSVPLSLSTYRIEHVLDVSNCLRVPWELNPLLAHSKVSILEKGVEGLCLMLLPFPRPVDKNTPDSLESLS